MTPRKNKSRALFNRAIRFYYAATQNFSTPFPPSPPRKCPMQRPFSINFHQISCHKLKHAAFSAESFVDAAFKQVFMSQQAMSAEINNGFLCILSVCEAKIVIPWESKEKQISVSEAEFFSAKNCRSNCVAIQSENWKISVNISRLSVKYFSSPETPEESSSKKWGNKWKLVLWNLNCRSGAWGI